MQGSNPSHGGSIARPLSTSSPSGALLRRIVGQPDELSSIVLESLESSMEFDFPMSSPAGVPSISFAVENRR